MEGVAVYDRVYNFTTKFVFFWFYRRNVYSRHSVVVTTMRIILLPLCLCIFSVADLFANKSTQPSDLILTHIVSRKFYFV